MVEARKSLKTRDQEDSTGPDGQDIRGWRGALGMVMVFRRRARSLCEEGKSGSGGGFEESHRLAKLATRMPRSKYDAKLAS